MASKQKKVIVIGSGFAGLSSACFLAKDGYEVTLLEKNDGPGGRASKFEANGFTFDMGPSWYWMPDVFEDFFAEFGKKPSDYYDLIRLDPSYRIYFGEDDIANIPSDMESLKAMFESLESGSAEKLDQFMQEAGRRYKIGMGDLVRMPNVSITEYFKIDLLAKFTELDLFNSHSSYVAKYFKHDKIRKILEFPIYFLGALPSKTPALYSLMNYADLKLGTWYPMGGMHKIIEGMVSLAEELGVKIQYNQNVTEITTYGKLSKEVKTEKETFKADVVVAGADYHHVDSQLLKNGYRNYSEKYWDKRVMAPSSIIYYVGLNKKIEGLKHHTLFFDQSFEEFGKTIYESPSWPDNPLFYLCAPSVTDPSVAPEGHENLFFLIPVAPGLEDTQELKDHYFNVIIDRLEQLTKQSIKDNVIYRKSFAQSDFVNRYNAYKGNAYGLANTLMQTAILKPRIKNKKIDNLYYTGQLTVPGPGVPPSIISGKIVADLISKEQA